MRTLLGAAAATLLAGLLATVMLAGTASAAQVAGPYKTYDTCQKYRKAYAAKYEVGACTFASAKGAWYFKYA